MARTTMKKHGRYGTGAYKAWADAKARCTNPSNRDWSHYGGRGISMCQEWADSFAQFLVDMGEKPSGMSLERINTQGNYEPGNCCWATRKTQSQNTRVSCVWRIGRKAFKSQADAATHFGVCPATIRNWCAKEGSGCVKERLYK